MKMPRFLITLVIISLILAITAGCATTSTTTATTTASGTTEATTAPSISTTKSTLWDWELDTKLIILTAYVHNVSAVTRWDTNANQTAKNFTEKTEITLQINNNSAKILWAKDETAAIAAYNAMLKEFEAAGVDKVYDYYTRSIW